MNYASNSNSRTGQGSSIILLPNANDVARAYLDRNNVVAMKKSLESVIRNNYKTAFVKDMQIYVTKIGLALSECAATVKMTPPTYLGSISYICKKLLKNMSLYNVMRGIGINESGNTIKHDIKDIDVDIDLVLNNYNRMISDIVKCTGLVAFKSCYLNRTVNVRDIPVIDEERHRKFFMVKNVKFQLKANENYQVDPYAKTVSSKITLYWPNGTPGRYVSIYIKCKKTGRILSSKEHVDIRQDNSKVALQFSCNETDLDRRVLYATAIIELEEYRREYSHTTGALFWKEDHYRYVYQTIERHEEEVSQFYKPNLKKY